MTAFFRFPHTPHLFWLGKDSPRDDKVLTPLEQADFLNHELLIEEKLDGANTGISFDSDGNLRIQNRGSYLSEPYIGQYAKLGQWLKPRIESLFDQLSDRFILFGEWCYAQHSLVYNSLPDWFVAFDLYDRQQQVFTDAATRDLVAGSAGVCRMPTVSRGHYKLEWLRNLVETQQSQFRDGHVEGVVLRLEVEGNTVARAKIVRPDFVQTIGEHWSRKQITTNSIATALFK